MHLADAAKRDAVAETKLTAEGRRQFDEASTKAPLPWNKNEARRAVGEATEEAGETSSEVFVDAEIKDEVREPRARATLRDCETFTRKKQRARTSRKRALR